MTLNLQEDPLNPCGELYIAKLRTHTWPFDWLGMKEQILIVVPI